MAELHPKNDGAAKPMSAERLAEIAAHANKCKCEACCEELELLAHIGVLTRALEIYADPKNHSDDYCYCGFGIARTALGKGEVMKYPRELLNALRIQGFKRTDRFSDGGVIYAKIVGDRRLELQLWPDGHHRVSHFLNGRMSTLPSDFDTLEQMKAAIIHELSRTDHPPRIP